MKCKNNKIKQIVHDMCKCFASNNAMPTTDLTWINPFTLAVSVLLSAQATDNSVNKATKELFKIADTPKKC